MVQLTREQLALPLPPPALGDVLDCQKGQLRAIQLTGIQEHGATPDGFKVVLDLEVGELMIRGQHFFQKPT